MKPLAADTVHLPQGNADEYRALFKEILQQYNDPSDGDTWDVEDFDDSFDEDFPAEEEGEDEYDIDALEHGETDLERRLNRRHMQQPNRQNNDSDWHDEVLEHTGDDWEEHDEYEEEL